MATAHRGLVNSVAAQTLPITNTGSFGAITRITGSAADEISYAFRPSTRIETDFDFSVPLSQQPVEANPRSLMNGEAPTATDREIPGYDFDRSDFLICTLKATMVPNPEKDRVARFSHGQECPASCDVDQGWSAAKKHPPMRDKASSWSTGRDYSNSGTRQTGSRKDEGRSYVDSFD